MSKPVEVEITLKETALSAEERETVSAYVAAKRAATQAAAIEEKLKPAVLALAGQHPDLLVDGARITLGSRKTWSYSAVIAGLAAALKTEKKAEETSGAATVKTTEFPVVEELEKFTGQAIHGITPGIWTRLLKR